MFQMGEISFEITIATWNVNNIEKGNKLHDIDAICQDLSDHKVDIACLQETKLLKQDKLDNQDYYFYWSGRNDESRIHGVGIMVKKRFVKDIETHFINEHCMYIRLNTPCGFINIFSVYCLHDGKSTAEKGKCYNSLDNKVNDVISTGEKIYLLGDFNAHIGSKSSLWHGCIGLANNDKLNANGRLLRKMCVKHGLFLRNTDLDVSEENKRTLKRKNKFYQNDYIISRKEDKSSLSQIKSITQFNKKSDHFLVTCKLKITGEINKINCIKSRQEIIEFLIEDNSPPDELNSIWEEIRRKVSFDDKLFAELYGRISKCLQRVSDAINNLKTASKNYHIAETEKTDQINKKSKNTDKIDKKSKITDKIDKKSKNFRILSNLREDLKQIVLYQVEFFCTSENDAHIIDDLIKQYEVNETGETANKEIKADEKFNFLTNLDHTSENSLIRVLEKLDTNDVGRFLNRCFEHTYIPKDFLFNKFIRVDENLELMNKLLAVKDISNTLALFVIGALEIQIRKYGNPKLGSNGIILFNSSESLIFTVHLLQDYNSKLYMAFRDLSHIIDIKNMHIIKQFLLRIGVDDKLVQFIVRFYRDLGTFELKNDNGILQMLKEKKQDTCIAPILFEMFLSYILTKSFNNINPIKFTVKTEKEIKCIARIRGLFYGNGLVLIAESSQEMELCLNNLRQELDEFGISIDSSSSIETNSDGQSSTFSIMAQNVQVKSITFNGIRFNFFDEIHFQNVIFTKNCSKVVTENIAKVKEFIQKCKMLFSKSTASTEERIDWYEENILPDLLHGLDWLIPSPKNLEDITLVHNTLIQLILTNKGTEIQAILESNRKRNFKFNINLNMRFRRLNNLCRVDVPMEIKELMKVIWDNHSSLQNNSLAYCSIIVEDCKAFGFSFDELPLKADILKQKVMEQNIKGIS